MKRKMPYAYATSPLYLDIKPILYVSNILGLAPYSIVKSKGITEVCFTKVTTAYCFFMNVLIFICNCVSIYSIIKFSDYKSAFYVSLSATFVSYIFCIQAAYSESFIRRGLTVTALNKIKEADDILNSNCYCFRTKSFSNAVLIQTCTCVLLFLLFNFILLWKLYLMQNKSTFRIYVWIGFGLSGSVMTLLQFLDLLFILLDRFKNLNLALSNLEARLKELSLIYPVMPERKNALDTARTISTLSQVHTILCDVCKMVGSIYSLHNLTILGQFFLGIVYCLHYIITNNILKQDLGEYSDPMWIWFIIWTLLWYSSGLIILALACSTTAQQAGKTAHLVHILSRKTKSHVVLKQLRQFSLQLLHRRFQFTACNFFPIDATLIYSVIGAGTTYLVMLVQFQLASTAD